jgi:metal-responsive CopG/Arc/MetJ family transcriptional regulator
MARAKKPLNLYLDADIMLALDRWIATQDIKPSRTATVEAALREFLERRKTRESKR